MKPMRLKIQPNYVSLVIEGEQNSWGAYAVEDDGIWEGRAMLAGKGYYTGLYSDVDKALFWTFLEFVRRVYERAEVCARAMEGRMKELYHNLRGATPKKQRPLLQRIRKETRETKMICDVALDLSEMQADYDLLRARVSQSVPRARGIPLPRLEPHAKALIRAMSHRCERVCELSEQALRGTPQAMETLLEVLASNH